MRLFPLFADLAGRDVLVVGGGAVAARKTAALLEAGARVTVGAPAFERGLHDLAAQGRVQLRHGPFEPRWLDAAWLVVAATDDRAVNAAVRDAATARRLWVNVVDDPELSAFQVPAVVDRAPLVIAISSGGAAPVLARRVRERLETMFDPSLGELAALAGRSREAIRAAFPDMPARRAFYDELWEGEVAALLRDGRPAEAEAALAAALSRPVTARPGQLVVLGTGTGQPGELTLAGLRALNEADEIHHHPSVPHAILTLARRDAELESTVAAAEPTTAQWQAWASLAAGGACIVVAATGAGPALPTGDASALQAMVGAGVVVRVVRGVS
ncbi:hypothetical protein IMZ29_03710 [Achromobacter sp. GG226]|nr:hypothetical protein [Verticiella sp. GG226]